MTTVATPVRTPREDAKRGFYDNKEFLGAVMDAGRGKLDSRLIPLRATQGSDEQGEYSDPAGGFLVPSAWAPTVLTRNVTDPAAGRTQPLTMTAPEVHLAARVDADHSTSVSGGLRMIRHQETVTVAPTRAMLEGIHLVANELMGVTFATHKLVMDSPQTVIDLLDRGYDDETRAVLLEERVRGTGVGECLGILNSAALITVPKDDGQSAGTLTGTNLTNIRKCVYGYERAIWILSIDLFDDVIQARLPIDGAVTPLWQPGNTEEGTPDLILGRPAFFHEIASSISNVGDVMCVNWSEYLDATYVPLSGMSSIHVRFEAFEDCFRYYQRGDGAPWWRTTLTAKRSETEVSPYVTLAARG